MVMPQHRPVLLGVFAAVLCAMISVTAVQARDADSATATNPIVARAFEDNGTWQGQCWQFMKKVIEEATGKVVGFDYREGYFEAGAFEVSVAQAKPGDVIQLADDSWTSPDADYPGLHTAIIYEVVSPGLFMVIDSNANYDEMVTTRLYDPAAAAARYSNINFHIYRFDETDRPSPDGRIPAPAAPRTPLAVGDVATVNTPGECLNIRTTPGGTLISCLAHRTTVKITSAPVTIGGVNWVQVNASGTVGWMAENYLDKSPVQGSGVGNTRPAQPFRLFIPLIGTDN